MHKTIRHYVVGSMFGALLVTSPMVMANEVLNLYAALNGLSQYSTATNQSLRVFPEVAQILDQDQAQDIATTLQDVVHKDNRGLEVIVQRASAESLQYQRVQGKAFPFFIMVRNHSNQPFSFKPEDVRLVVNGQQHKPLQNRQLEKVLKSTKANRSDLSYLVNNVQSLANIASGISVDNAKNIAQDVLVGVASGKGVDQVIYDTVMSNPVTQNFQNIIKNDVAQNFQKGDEFLVHFDEVKVGGYRITSLNLFFDGVTMADRNMELYVPVQQNNQVYTYKFKFVQPVVTVNTTAQN